jgi:hypothetical protein
MTNGDVLLSLCFDIVRVTIVLVMRVASLVDSMNGVLRRAVLDGAGSGGLILRTGAQHCAQRTGSACASGWSEGLPM